MEVPQSDRVEVLACVHRAGASGGLVQEARIPVRVLTPDSSCEAWEGLGQGMGEDIDRGAWAGLGQGMGKDIGRGAWAGLEHGMGRGIVDMVG